MSKKNIYKELHILILEDVPDDAKLIEHELRKAGIEFSLIRVETKKAFIKELEDFIPDLIFADYSLPMFDALSALSIAKEKCPDVPFILVSGAISEELAIEIFKRGATDVVFKHRLFRLVPAVHRALREAEEMIKRKKVEARLALYKEIFANASDAIAVTSPEGYYIEQNVSHSSLTGYSDNELYGKTPVIHLGDEVFSIIAQELAMSGRYRGEVTSRKKSGELVTIELSAFAVRNDKGEPICYVGINRDISDRKKMEEELKKRVKELEEFYEMAVGRELRMIELKKEIERLREELERYKNP